MISSKKYVDETLKKYHLVANKALGQNFLVEENIASDIVNSANITSNSLVIEVGPGLGALSEFILLKAKKLVLFEIDQNMVNILKETFKDKTNLEIIHEDFLKVDFDNFMNNIDQNIYSEIIFISNLPYYITSKILNKIIINNYNIKTIVVMMQKEVGQKILKPQKKDYNLLSVILDYQYESSIVKYVGKNSYLPRPVIDSIVLKFTKIEPRFSLDFKNLIKISSTLFASRRKTLLNNLKVLGYDILEIKEKLSKINLNENLRIEQLDIQDIINIANNFVAK